ncbi:ribonucleoside-diphosphate reductase subunit alpha [Brevibacillus gelatini]|uniref:Ribonucleoside-diphosphate reductase n=1 Tax=Brevibacillus gelatini TaxID=1655277 RepID=A0A3M8B7G5_9BACL|nr:ribonucleoside-diphosphate reductase subunit alpha [Brevibacillus gelatini]RNB59384.1 ribonucleoside-diphosphate reductase subunit alpha [Brevibacillus gelatini]
MTLVLKNRKSHIQKSEFEPLRFTRFVDEIVKDTGKTFSSEQIEELKATLIEEILTRKEIEADKLFDLIIREANERIDKYNPHFTFLSASAMRRKLYKQASKERGFDYKKGYGDYYSLVYSLTEKGIYADDLIKSYTKDELVAAGNLIDKDKDRLFSYAGLFLMNKNYLAKGYNNEVLELPQERFMTTALYLLKDENKDKRFEYIKEAYWALSNHYIGLATPTLMSSGRPMGSLSSCHIQTFDDSLVSITDVWKDASIFSQNGSGVGFYLGLLRAEGSWIRGYKGRASGIIPMARVLNAIADYVDQLGSRKAGFALYTPDFHLDIMDFLDLRLKTGSQERRAHSVFIGICLHDEFMRRLINRDNWTLFDPYEVRTKLGFDLNFLFDKKRLDKDEEPNREDHAFTYHYRIAEKADLKLKKTVKATDIYKKIYESQKTSGVPYIYFSDTCARFNPNSHAGVPLGSNLCSEIVQNMATDEFIHKALEEDGEVVEIKKGEGLVTCNLSSLVLHNVFTQDIDLQRVVDIQFRLLDNVISLNRTPVEQATYTNQLYRAVGAGALGLATLLADKGISWESNQASEYVDEIFEKIAYANILASHKLAVEKGSYPLFKGSKWNTGEYFDERGYNSLEWQELKSKVMNGGIRNSYLAAVAPTGSNSIIMNGSPSLDALYEVIYQEEKAGMKVTMVPINFSPKTIWFYKSAFEMDEMWSLKIVSAAQRHIDQSISHNVHVHKDIKASELLRLHIAAWESNIKTLYYTYTDTNAVNRSGNCIACEA